MEALFLFLAVFAVCFLGGIFFYVQQIYFELRSREDREAEERTRHLEVLP